MTLRFVAVFLTFSRTMLDTENARSPLHLVENLFSPAALLYQELDLKQRTWNSFPVIGLFILPRHVT